MSLEKFRLKPFPFFQVPSRLWKLLSLIALTSMPVCSVLVSVFDSVLASDELDVDSDDCEELEDSELSDVPALE